MEHSKVYRRIHFLLHLQEAPASERKTMLMNITTNQIQAINIVAGRVVSGVVSPLRRDAQLFRRRRTLLRTLASDDVSVTRKKALLRRYHSTVPVILRTPYLIQVILDEIRTARDE